MLHEKWWKNRAWQKRSDPTCFVSSTHLTSPDIRWTRHLDCFRLKSLMRHWAVYPTSNLKQEAGSDRFYNGLAMLILARRAAEPVFPAPPSEPDWRRIRLLDWHLWWATLPEPSQSSRQSLSVSKGQGVFMHTFHTVSRKFITQHHQAGVSPQL